MAGVVYPCSNLGQVGYRGDVLSNMRLLLSRSALVGKGRPSCSEHPRATSIAAQQNNRSVRTPSDHFGCRSEHPCLATRVLLRMGRARSHSYLVENLTQTSARTKSSWIACIGLLAAPNGQR